MVLFSASLFSLTATAQEPQLPPISTERPSVGYSPDLIPAGSVQFENGAGASFQKTKFTGDLPETLVRLGLSERVELRYMWSDEVYQKSPLPHVASFQSMDPALSVKVGLGKVNPVVPKSGVLSLSFPRGGPSWTSGSYDPGMIAIWSQAIGKKYSVTEIAGATLTTSSGARRACWAPSVGVVRGLTGNLSAFAEYAPTVLGNGTLEYVVDGGFTLVRKNLVQFDLRAGYLKDPDGYQTQISIGYSIRRDNFLPRLAHVRRP